jgi:hypothetical protein
MTAQRDRQRADERPAEMIEDFADMCRRVLQNGPERSYADEKLAFGVRRLARAPVIIGWRSELVCDAAAETAERGGERW